MPSKKSATAVQESSPKTTSLQTRSKGVTKQATKKPTQLPATEAVAKVTETAPPKKAPAASKASIKSPAVKKAPAAPKASTKAPPVKKAPAAPMAAAASKAPAVKKTPAAPKAAVAPMAAAVRKAPAAPKTALTGSDLSLDGKIPKVADLMSPVGSAVVSKPAPAAKRGAKPGAKGKAEAQAKDAKLALQKKATKVTVTKQAPALKSPTTRKASAAAKKTGKTAATKATAAKSGASKASSAKPAATANTQAKKKEATHTARQVSLNALASSNGGEDPNKPSSPAVEVTFALGPSAGPAVADVQHHEAPTGLRSTARMPGGIIPILVSPLKAVWNLFSGSGEAANR